MTHADLSTDKPYAMEAVPEQSQDIYPAYRGAAATHHGGTDSFAGRSSLDRIFASSISQMILREHGEMLAELQRNIDAAGDNADVKKLLTWIMGRCKDLDSAFVQLINERQRQLTKTGRHRLCPGVSSRHTAKRTGMTRGIVAETGNCRLPTSVKANGCRESCRSQALAAKRVLIEI